MPLTDEVILMLAIAGLYLYDSTLLLYCNEGILVPKGKDDWAVRFGFDDARILGKDVFVPNIFLPHRPLFRLSWAFEGGAAEGTADWAARRNALGPLAPLVWGMALALFVCLPLGFFTTLADRMLIAGILLLYVNIGAALLWRWLHRAMLGLTGKQFAALAFESLVCSPFALNLVRNVSLKMPVTEDLAHAARRLQKADGWNTTRATLVARLDEAIEGEDDDTPRMLALREHRRSLT